MKRTLRMMLALLLVFGCIAPGLPAAEAAAAPVLSLDRVPEISGGSTVSGHIWFDGAAGSYSDYSVTMALAVARGEGLWAPKPTHATPSVPVGNDGKFECMFVSGGYDSVAEELYIYLIPRNFVPTSNTNRTLENSLDHIVIYRDADGSVDFTQRVDPNTLPDPVETTVFAPSKYPSLTPKLSICYSPYTNGLSPETNSAVPAEHMEWLLNLVYPYADTLRLFGTSGELEKIYKPAKERYGFRIMGGCWIDSRYSETQIYAELDGLIKLVNDGYIDIAVVGSEMRYRGDFTVDEIITFIEYVRERVPADIPVATSDTAGAFLDSQRLVDACDMVLFTNYPFFEKVPIADAPQALFNTYDKIKKMAGEKPVIISETGWVDAGSPEGAAVPSMENCKKYFEAVYNWSRQNNVEVVFFSQMDEIWKREGSSGDIGSHWGHFYANGVLKEAYRAIYNEIAPKPVDDAETVSWAENEILELIRQGIISPMAPSAYDPVTPIKRGDMMHYLMNALFPDSELQVEPTFTDVSPNMYYYYSIGLGQRESLILGLGNNLSGVELNISRQDLFLLIYRGMLYAGMDVAPNLSVLDRFNDVDNVGEYAREAVSALVSGGIVHGDDLGNINPRSEATRAEAAMLLYRIYTHAKTD